MDHGTNDLTGSLEAQNFCLYLRNFFRVSRKIVFTDLIRLLDEFKPTQNHSKSNKSARIRTEP